jgi:hypothetical protein
MLAVKSQEISVMTGSTWWPARWAAATATVPFMSISLPLR